MSVTLLPRIPIEGYEDLSPEQAAELLHQEKNRPEGIPSAVLRKVTRPWHTLSEQEKMFPFALYREWEPKARDMARHRAAARMNINLAANNPIELELVDQTVGEWNSTNAISQEHMDQLLAAGWQKSIADARAAAFLSHRQLATDAAVSNTDDRKILSEKALAHRDAVEDAADEHITEIPRTPVRPKGTRMEVR